MPKTKIAVIGLGGVAQLVHIPLLTRMNDVEICAVAEINKNRLNTIADKFSIKSRFTDFRQMLAETPADAVIVATPTSTHREVAVECLKAGKDTLIEKPLARTFAEAKSIVDAANKYKRKIMVGMNLRYRPDAMILKSILNSGELGKLIYLKSSWIRRQSSREEWFTRPDESGGGVIIDLGILLLDLCLWLLEYPKIETVFTNSFYMNSNSVEDTSVSLVKCAGPALINIETSWTLPLEKDQFTLTVYGTKGNATLNPFAVHKKVEEHFIDMTPSLSGSHTHLFKKSYLNELKSFIGAVKGLHPVVSSAEEALQRMKIVEAMYKSARINSEVKLSKTNEQNTTR